MNIHKQKKALTQKISDSQKLTPLEKVKVNRLIRKEEAVNFYPPITKGMNPAGYNSNF